MVDHETRQFTIRADRLTFAPFSASVRQPDGRWTTVEDDGPGLADDELEAVFEPFRRDLRSRSRETGGAGLGLTVARQAARAHGGDVILSNRSQGGLTARLTLPLAVGG